MIVSVASWQMWVGFIAFVVVVLLVDLFLLGANRPHKMSFREAIAWSVFWVILALIFNVLLWFYLVSKTHTVAVADEATMNFFTGYLLEKALAVDNIFLFLLIFREFKVPEEYQRRVFLYGIMGALVFRGIMIILGSVLIQKFEWILYVFGAFLLITGIKMFWVKESVHHVEHHPLIKFLGKHLRLTKDFYEEKFFVKIKGLWHFTPLFLVLALIELSDVIFATDSIPAIFAITTDPFIVFTSNVFAILGLRALYFLLANAMAHFYYLQYGLALILVLIGTKLLIAPWLHISAVVSLIVIAIILLCTVLLSMLRNRKYGIQ